MNLYTTLLNLTTSCTKNCYYCSIWKNNENSEIDLDFLKAVLDDSPTNSCFELTGGEPGLISNIDQVFRMVYGHPHTKEITLLSNGYLRYKGVDWLDKITSYREHLVYDIDGKEVQKFYPLPFTNLGKTIIVTTFKTTKSLLNNWKYFKDSEYVSDKFHIKIMKLARTENTLKHATLMADLFSKLDDKYSYNMTQKFISGDSHFIERDICSKNPPHPFIDFITKEIGHCACRFITSKRVSYSRQNYLELRRGTLFFDYAHCSDCYTFDCGNNKIKYILNCLHGNYMNRDFSCR